MSDCRIIEFAELDSTNRYACARLDELAHGDVIHAAVQTAGHGRMGRRWISHVPGNLCMSIVLKPCHAAPADLPLANLSQLLALGVCHVLDGHGVRATLKWPNDVLVGGRKIAGLLAESVVRGPGEFLGMVLGLGVNLNLDEPSLATIDQPASSLAAATGASVDVPSFRDGVLGFFFERCDRFLETGFVMIRDEYLGRCAFLGSHVEVRRGGESICGRAVGLDCDGALQVEAASGHVRSIELGEMFQVG